MKTNNLAMSLRNALSDVIADMSVTQTLDALQYFLEIQQELLDHLAVETLDPEDTDVSVYIPKTMVDEAGIAPGVPLDIQLNGDGMYISKAPDEQGMDALLSILDTFFSAVEFPEEDGGVYV